MGPQIGCIVLDGKINSDAWLEIVKGQGYIIGNKEKTVGGVEYIMIHKKG